LTHRLLQLAPLLATCVLAAGLLLPHGPGAVMIGAALLALAAAVTAAVHHAEVVALRVGEPFGTLVLALAVTVIEVSLILSVMLAGGEQQAALPRDTIYAAVMIICNGVVGLCLLVGGLRHHEQSFRIEGAGSGLAALIALATLSLVLPTFTVSSPIGTYTDSQLAFVGTMSLLLWGVFVFVQTVRHRDYFLPPGAAADAQAHAAPPTRATTAVSLGLLLLSLVAVVGLAKLLSPAIERAVAGTASPRCWWPSRSPCSCCSRRPGPPCAPRARIACRPA
jgi:Ca2+:H+ antiporter